MYPVGVIIKTCRACGSDLYREVLNLGTHAVSDFVSEGAEIEVAPLTLMLCDVCGLVQLQHTVPRERLYRHYWYRSGTNETMVAALRELVLMASQYADIGPGNVWVDVGANDGTLLGHVGDLYPGVIRIGFEPAENLLWDAMKKAEAVIPSFFPPEYDINPRPKVITSVAMFYDLEEPERFVEAIKRWLHSEGIWIVQMAMLEDMLASYAFDNVCHKHLAYYDWRSFASLLAKYGLRVIHQSRNTVNGGSHRFVICNSGSGIYRNLPRMDSALPTRSLKEFALTVPRLKAQTLSLLWRLKDEGKLVLGYGASTKGNTLLQYYEIGANLLPAIADRNPDKHGLRTAGSDIPIISEEEMRERRPDYLFVLPWHFMSSFRARERVFLARGGHFIVPLPNLHIEGPKDEPSLSAKSLAAFPGA